MSDFSDILSRELLRLQEDIIDTMEANDQRATGKTIARLRTLITPQLGQLVGPHHLRYLRDGRGPGGVSVSAIREWIAAKRLPLNPYAVAARISQLGTLLFRNEDPRFQKPADTFDAPIRAALPRLRAALADATRQEFLSQVVPAFKLKL